MNPRNTSALIISMALQALWTSGAFAQQPSTARHDAPQEQFTCRLPGTAEHRQIGIFRPGPPQRCRVDYTRNGKTRSLWSSGHDYRFCVRKALQIVGLLEKVHFKCSPHTTSTGSDQNR
jgi:hypothetical protein